MRLRSRTWSSGRTRLAINRGSWTAQFYAIDSHGDNVIVGGTFSTIRNSAVTDPEILQKYLFKFNVATGEIDPGFRSRARRRG